MAFLGVWCPKYQRGDGEPTWARGFGRHPKLGLRAVPAKMVLGILGTPQGHAGNTLLCSYSAAPLPPPHRGTARGQGAVPATIPRASPCASSSPPGGRDHMSHPSPATDAWQVATPPPSPRSRFAGEAVVLFIGARVVGRRGLAFAGWNHPSAAPTLISAGVNRWICLISLGRAPRRRLRQRGGRLLTPLPGGTRTPRKGAVTGLGGERDAALGVAPAGEKQGF